MRAWKVNYVAFFFVHSPMTACTLALCAGGNIVRAHSPLFVSISQWAYKHATTERCTGAGILRCCCCSCWCGLQQWPVWIIQNGAPSFWGLFVGLVSPCSLSDFPSGGREGRELLGRWACSSFWFVQCLEGKVLGVIRKVVCSCIQVEVKQ